MNKILKQILLFSFTVLCNSMNAFDQPDSTSLYLMEKTWTEFRAIHPYSFQSVGRKYYGNTCVLVISEPAEWVKKEKLKGIFDKYQGHFIIRHQPIGIDGMLTDAVGLLKLDTIQYTQFEKELFNLLYYTNYIPVYTDLDKPLRHIYFSDIPLNLSYTSEFLNLIKFPIHVQYFDDHTTHPVLIDCSRSNCEICKLSNHTTSWISKNLNIENLCNYSILGSNEIFKNDGNNYIVWLIDEKIDFNKDSTFLINARRFTLDSDLILGTYKSKHKIAIIGRCRKVPFSHLPPLRPETILLLANNSEAISLVFDDNRIKLINDSIYATPIKMSDALCNNELGILMIMSDIYLKSWSENGKNYEYIINSPRPNKYPFPNGVSKELGVYTKYFWNFTNICSGIPGFLPIIQTGSLPPTYMSSNDSLLMEQNAINNIAYKYFSSLNNPELVRINMYAAIYRIFRDFGVKKSNKVLDSWIQTPSYVVSNARLGYGGIKDIAQVTSKIVSKKISQTIATQSSLRKFSTINFTENLSSKTLNIVIKNIHRINSVDKHKIPFSDLSKIQETLILQNEVLELLYKNTFKSQNLKTINNTIIQNKLLLNKLIYQRDIVSGEKTCGIIIPQKPNSKDFNSSSKVDSIRSLIVYKRNILTRSEINEKIFTIQRNENIRNELYEQIRRYGIPLKAIVDEINYTVYIIKFIDDELKYDYAA